MRGLVREFARARIVCTRVRTRVTMVHLSFFVGSPNVTPAEGPRFLLHLLSLLFLISRSHTLFEIRTSKLRSIILQERSGAQWRRRHEEVEELLASFEERIALACNSKYISETFVTNESANYSTVRATIKNAKDDIR